MAEGQALKRRGILAAAGAVVAGIVAKQAAQPALAAYTLMGDTTNTSTTTTTINVTPGFSASSVLAVDASAASASPTGILAISARGGVEVVGGISAAGSNGPLGALGVYAIGGTATTPGMRGGIGINALSGSGFTPTAGIWGQGLGPPGSVGVAGTADVGIYGTGGTAGITTAIVPGGIGVQAVAISGIGTYSTSISGTGVFASSNSGTGIYGLTNGPNQYGVLGTTTAANSTAIAGIANTNGSSAFSGGTTNPNAYAAVFQGTVFVGGKLIVSDPSYKSGALAHPDGSTRLVYCMESPESWIEDFGTGTLAGGTAAVKLDGDFAAVTHTDDYHVFLTPYGDSKGLYVTTKSASGFAVHEQQGGTSTLAFSWRVVAKPKSSVKQERLAKFVMPKVALPDPAKIKVPEATATITLPSMTTTPTGPTGKPPVAAATATPPSPPSTSPTGAQPPAASLVPPGSAPNPLPVPRP